MPDAGHPLLSVEDLRRQVAHGDVDTVLVVLGFAGIWWLVSARRWFTGPKVQGSPEELAAAERELESLA